MGGLIDTDTGLHFGEGLQFQTVIGGDSLIIVPDTAMVKENGTTVMITEDGKVMVTE